VKFRTRHRRSFGSVAMFPSRLAQLSPASARGPFSGRQVRIRCRWIGGFQFTRPVFLSVFGLISHKNPYNSQGFFQSLSFGSAVALVVQPLKPLKNKSLYIWCQYIYFFTVPFTDEVVKGKLPRVELQVFIAHSVSLM
jgi:hypothetical protein